MKLIYKHNTENFGNEKGQVMCIPDRSVLGTAVSEQGDTSCYKFGDYEFIIYQDNELLTHTVLEILNKGILATEHDLPDDLEIIKHLKVYIR